MQYIGEVCPITFVTTRLRATRRPTSQLFEKSLNGKNLMDPFEGGDELTADIFHVQGRLDLIVTLPSEQHPALQSFRFTSLLSEI